MDYRWIKFVLVVTLSLFHVWVPAIWGDKTFINLVDETLIQKAHAETKKKDAKKTTKKVQRFSTPKDGVITDTKTGLQWAQDTRRHAMNWFDATAYVQNLKIGGYSGWRLPTREELESLLSYCKSEEIPVEEGKCAEYYNKIGFNLQSHYHWSSTSYAYFVEGVWIVHVWYGTISSGHKSDENGYVWPVRSGQ